jgi:nicotinate-nucleotide adenylyltransferase
MRIGVLGGTFDPPHIGHQILAAEALHQLHLDRVLWVLTPYPPHKKQRKITMTACRQCMINLAISGNPQFILSSVDINRPPPHYAVDTMTLLKHDAPNDEFYYLMGLDSLNDLLKWHQPIEFIKLCHGLGVMLRHGETVEIPQIENRISDISQKLFFLNTPIIEISASDIRTRVAHGNPYRYLVPEKVFQYIQDNQLYK